MVDRVCQYCGKQYSAARITSKFCSVACKGSFHRLPNSVSASVKSIEANLDALDDLMGRYPHLAAAVDSGLMRAGARYRRVLERARALR